MAAGVAALAPALPGLVTPSDGVLEEPGRVATRRSRRAHLAAFIDQQRIAGDFPALGTAAVSRGEVVWARGSGLANIQTGLHASHSTPFMIASVSKTVVSVAVMQVWERGKLGLDDDVNLHLPFPIRNPNAPADPITVRQLLTHTSSIKDNWHVLSPLYVKGDSPIPLGSFMHDYFTPGGQYYSPEGNFHTYAPGTHYNYANMGASLAGYLVEAITGTPFDRWCTDQIFTPLGMADTSYRLSDLDSASVAMPYRCKSSGCATGGQYGYPDYPDGMIRTSPLSLGKFLAAFSAGGIYRGTRILQASTVELMLTPQLGHLVPFKQGLIWFKRPTIGPYWGHDGGDVGVSALMFFRRSDLSGGVVLANADTHAQVLSRVLARLIDEAALL